MTASALSGNALGIQAAVWTEQLTATALGPVFQRAAALGYDIVELIVPAPATLDAPAVREAADAAGVALGMITALSPTTDITSVDAQTRRLGEQHLRAAIDTAQQLGVATLGGVLHGALARHTALPEPGAADRSADVLRSVSELADSAGVTLALEIVNRYGNNLLNTALQARRFLELVGSPRVRAHLDTFHMHIEEADVANAVSTVGAQLAHVHVGESDRGHLGRGRFPFAEFFAALATAGYRGAITVETFSPGVTPGLAAAVASWRSVWDDPDDLARQAHAFLGSSTGRHDEPPDRGASPARRAPEATMRGAAR